MSNKNAVRTTLAGLGVAAGAVLAAAFLPVAVASADDTDMTFYVPDTSTFSSNEAIGLPPLFEDVIGPESWNFVDATNSANDVTDAVKGTDNVFTAGSFTNDDFIVKSVAADAPAGAPTAGSELDYVNFGFGFANFFESVPADLPGVTAATTTDVLITPFGDFTLF